MAVLNLDLLNSDQTINSDNADDTNTVNLTAVGSHTLTVDGVSATIAGIAGVQALSSPTFAAVNDGNMTVDYGVLGVNALSGVTYNIGDTSNISVEGPALANVNLGTQTINFSGNGAGSFTYDKGLLDTVSAFDVNGFSWGDSVGVDGYFDAWPLRQSLSRPDARSDQGACHGLEHRPLAFRTAKPTIAARLSLHPLAPDGSAACVGFAVAQCRGYARPLFRFLRAQPAVRRLCRRPHRLPPRRCAPLGLTDAGLSAPAY